VLCYRLYAVLLLLCCTVIVLLLLLFVLSLLLFVLSYVLILCTVPLPPGVNPIAVDKYINQYTQSDTSSAARVKFPTDHVTGKNKPELFDRSSHTYQNLSDSSVSLRNTKMNNNMFRNQSVNVKTAFF
jgi:ABC-type bacteriocin/lantibiotic exporter with double-glycine peptidase domain